MVLVIVLPASNRKRGLHFGQHIGQEVMIEAPRTTLMRLHQS